MQQYSVPVINCKVFLVNYKICGMQQFYGQQKGDCLTVKAEMCLVLINAWLTLGIPFVLNEYQVAY